MFAAVCEHRRVTRASATILVLVLVLNLVACGGTSFIRLVAPDGTVTNVAALIDPVDGADVRPVAVAAHPNGFVVAAVAHSDKIPRCGNPICLPVVDEHVVVGGFDADGAVRWTTGFAHGETDGPVFAGVDSLAVAPDGTTFVLGTTVAGSTVEVDGDDVPVPPSFVVALDDEGSAVAAPLAAEGEFVRPFGAGVVVVGDTMIELDSAAAEVRRAGPLGLVSDDVDVGPDGEVVVLFRTRDLDGLLTAPISADTLAPLGNQLVPDAAAGLEPRFAIVDGGGFVLAQMPFGGNALIVERRDAEGALVWSNALADRAVSSDGARIEIVDDVVYLVGVGAGRSFLAQLALGDGAVLRTMTGSFSGASPTQPVASLGTSAVVVGAF